MTCRAGSLFSGQACRRRTRTKRRENLSLWERILGLLEEDLARRRERRIFVRVPDGDGSYEEIGELSSERLRSLDSGLHGWAAEQLLDRYLAEGGYVDLLGKRHAYTKRIDDLVPEDLAAVVRSDQMKVEVYLEERDRARAAADVHRDLERLGTLGYAATGPKLSGSGATLPQPGFPGG